MSSATAAAAAAGVPAAQASAEGFAGAMIAALVVAAAGLVTAVFYARFTKRRPASDDIHVTATAMMNTGHDR